MFTLSGITKAFGGRTLFADVTTQINRGDRIGLVGPNGAGKSTLFRVILGEEEADAGQIMRERNATLGFLPQESAPVGDETVLDLALAVSPEMREAREWVKDPEKFFEEHPDKHFDPHTRYAELNGFELEARAKTILAGLAFRVKDFDRPTKQLSGGWVMRAHLARLLVQQPDLLMLDEPTNHLDLFSLNWFREYLKGYPGGILMISHDRDFLNQLITGVLEIRAGRVYRYTGNYDSFLTQREANEQQLQAAYKNQQREIDRLQTFADRFGAKASKASQAQAKLKQIERMEKIELPDEDRRKVKIKFPQPERSGQRVISLKDIHHAYGPNVVYAGMEFEAERGQRIVLVGPNGAGKSTLLKLLAEAVPLQRGERKLGHNVRAGYFSQYRADTMDLNATVLAEALGVSRPTGFTEENVRTLLGSFLFSGDDVFKPVRVLSGGEKSRLALAKLLIDPPNLLLMDEPTTHLDIPSIDSLIEALQQYSGTLIFISHDVHFIRHIANHVIEVRDGRLRPFPGGYQYYLDKTAAEAAPVAKPGYDNDRRATATSGINRKEQKRLEAEARHQRSQERRAHQKAVEALEKRIQHLETLQQELALSLEQPETHQHGGRARQINLELADVANELAAANREWEAAAEKLTANAG
jgi:ATP-binding cassette, subfamily F, member 3